MGLRDRLIGKVGTLVNRLTGGKETSGKAQVPTGTGGAGTGGAGKATVGAEPVRTATRPTGTGESDFSGSVRASTTSGNVQVSSGKRSEETGEATAPVKTPGQSGETPEARKTLTEAQDSGTTRAGSVGRTRDESVGSTRDGSVGSTRDGSVGTASDGSVGTAPDGIMGTVDIAAGVQETAVVGGREESGDGTVPDATGQAAAEESGKSGMSEGTPGMQAEPSAAESRTTLKSGNDAPTRAAHLRPTFGQSGQAHQVRVTNPENGQEMVFSCEPGEYIVEAAERAGMELPASCRNGGCLTCTGKLLEGTATIEEEQYVLEDEHLERGFRLLCCTTVHSDAAFLSHQQEEL